MVNTKCRTVNGKKSRIGAGTAAGELVCMWELTLVKACQYAMWGYAGQT
jgi:hypothetical protein